MKKADYRYHAFSKGSTWHSQSFYESGSKVEGRCKRPLVYHQGSHRATLLAGSRSVSILTILKKKQIRRNRLEIDR